MLDFECATISDFALASGGFGQDIFAIVARNHWLSVAEYNAGFVAASTLHVHEIGVGSWDQSLQLVGLSLVFVRWVQ